jgi:hypothetical protein
MKRLVGEYIFVRSATDCSESLGDLYPLTFQLHSTNDVKGAKLVVPMTYRSNSIVPQQDVYMEPLSISVTSWHALCD